MPTEIPSGLTPEEQARVQAETPQAPAEQPKLSSAERMKKGLLILEKLRGATLPFPGIPTSIFADLVLQYNEIDEEDQIFVTSPSKKVELFKEHGIKIVPGSNPDSRDMFVIPANMDASPENITEYSMRVQQLDPTRVENPDLKELIELFSKK
jgi:hypothetical protein